MAMRNASQKDRSRTPTTQTASAATRASGPVDASGKRHRKPPLQEPIDKRMGNREANFQAVMSFDTHGALRDGSRSITQRKGGSI